MGVSQALYRRYRPETFADVIGQEHVTDPLMQALRTGRVNHAYLFSGPRGCGKTTSARILARCLNCEQGPTDLPCGRCESCVALARGGAGTVDVIEIDAASHGGVDDARELRERASYGPAQSRYKIYIIDEAHMVTTQGFNALLKIVEEPPEHVKFVFATTEPEKVIGTIRSRTHHYPFRLVPPAQLQDYLASVSASEGVAVEAGVLSFVVRAGGGSVRDSLSVLDQLIAGSGDEGLTYEGAAALLGFTDAELLDATVTAIGHGDAAAAFAQIDRVIETGLDPRRFVEDLLERFRDLIICAAMPDGAAAVLRGIPADQLERMHVQAAAFGPGALSRAADVVNAGLAEMTGATAPRLQLELILARLLLPGAAGPRGYAARLDRLERRLDMGGLAQVQTVASAPPDSPPTAPESSRQQPTAAEPRAPAQPTAQQRDKPAGPSQQPEPSPGGPPPSGPQSGPAPAQAPSAGAPTAPAPPARSPAPEHSAPEASAAASSAQEPPPVPSRPAQTVAAGLDQAAVVRAWPDILDWLSRNKRVTWTLVSANAQPLTFDGARLVLAIETAGLAETFRRGAHPAFVQEALLEVLGITAKVEGVVSATAKDAGRGGTASAGAVTTPAAVGGPAQPSQSPAQSVVPQAPQGRPDPIASVRPATPAAGGDFVPDPRPARTPPASGPDWSSAPPTASSAPSWATDGDDPLDRTPSRAGASVSQSGRAASNEPGVPTAVAPLGPSPQPSPQAAPQPGARPEDLTDDPDAISDDDEDIEASGEVGEEVVRRLLGGTVISEDAH